MSRLRSYWYILMAVVLVGLPSYLAYKVTGHTWRVTSQKDEADLRSGNLYIPPLKSGVKAEMLFITKSGDYVRVTGKVAEDMVNANVFKTGGAFILSYETTIVYNRHQEAVDRYDNVVSWKKLDQNATWDNPVSMPPYRWWPQRPRWLYQ